MTPYKNHHGDRTAEDLFARDGALSDGVLLLLALFIGVLLGCWIGHRAGYTAAKAEALTQTANHNIETP